MSGQQERNRRYLELWDAFHRRGCPVCGCAAERVMRRIRESLGGEPGENAFFLCSSHTRVLASNYDECGSAAALRFIRRVETWVRDALERHKGKPSALGLVKAVFADREMQLMETDPAKCPACRLERHEEQKTLAVLVDALTDPDFHRAFRESDGLCLYHLGVLSNRASGKAAVDTVLREQLRRLEDLRDAFVASRFQPDRAGIPADPAAWVRFFVLMGAPTEQRLELETETPSVSGEGGGLLPIDSVEVQDDPDDGPETERFEKEKWRRAREMLQRRLSEESSRAAALHYRYWKAMEDNKTLQMNLSGAQALARSLQEQVDRLKETMSTAPPKGHSADETGGRKAG